MSIKYLENWAEFNLLQNLHLCTQKSVCARHFGPLGEIGANFSLQLSSRTHVAKINNKKDIIEAFNSSSRYLDDLLNIDNPYFEQMVGQIYPTELQLNKVNSSDTEAPFFDLNLSIINGIVPSKMYDKQDDFNFEMVNPIS